MIPANSMGPPAGIAGIPQSAAPRLLFLLTTEKNSGDRGRAGIAVAARSFIQQPLNLRGGGSCER